MRGKKALANTLSSLILQFVTVICGFIIPRLILETFGSSINGLVGSITQFLGYIVLVEAGVGGVVQAALYKPLANNDIIAINRIIKATEKFFQMIAYTFAIYIIIVALIYPYLINQSYDNVFTFSLVMIIGISTFVKYYFGITYQILLQADQRYYFVSGLQIFTTIINTILVVILIKTGFDIHTVKLGSALIYIIQPIILIMYVKRKHTLIKDIHADNSSIKQKWDGFGQHIAYFIHTNTDIVILTIFTTLKEVSVYSIYFMIVAGIQQVTNSISTGLSATIGNMIAKAEFEILNKRFNVYDLFNFIIITILFTSTSILIVPFVSVYTNGINDVNYIRPIFAYFLVAAEAVYCLRIPYSNVTLSAGHYKQTTKGAYFEAFINIILSLILVSILGIIGIAIGTLVAMMVRTVDFILYLSKNILNKSIWYFIKRFIVNIVAVLMTVISVKIMPSINIDSYGTWCLYAIEVTVITIVITMFINALFYFNDLKQIFLLIRGILVKRKIAS